MSADIRDPQLSNRLQKTASDLRDLEQLLISGDVEPRLLLEFREAVNHVRHTSWVVQKWLEKREQKQDTFEVLAMLTAERVRVTGMLAKELAMDLDAAEVGVDTPGMKELRANMALLLSSVERFFNR